MKIEDVIQSKGNKVVTIAPSATVTELIALLADFGIGAVVVSTDGVHIAGIISERDVVRAIAKEGPVALERTVAALMTTEVATAAPAEEIEEVAHTMTYRRFRHLPVVAGEELIGIVSIGDVVKHRIDQLTDERNHLLGYLHS